MSNPTHNPRQPQPRLQRRPASALWALAASFWLSACGGGDSGNNSLPAFSQDIAPAGDRVDLRAQNYFPWSTVGNSWNYQRSESGVPSGSATTQIRSTDAGVVTMVTTELEVTETQYFRRDDRGIWAVNLLTELLGPTAGRVVGDLLIYPEPFYTGGAWKMIRQGDLGLDLDGDGQNESFRLEVSQTYQGQANDSLPDGRPVQVAVFRLETTMLVALSKSGSGPVSVSSYETSRWAPGVGLIQSDRSAIESDGASIMPFTTLRLSSAWVDGVWYGPAP